MRGPLYVSFLFLVGCQGAAPPASDTGAATSSSPMPAASARRRPAPEPTSSAPLPPPYTGPLTVALVQSAKGSLPAPKPLRVALGGLVAKLGTPTRTREGTTVGPLRKWYEWAATDGKVCATYSAVEQPDLLGGPGKLVDNEAKTAPMPAHVVDDPSGANKEADLSRGWRDFTACVEILGQKAGLPPDDAKGKAPGGAITHASLMRGLYDAPGKWIGKTVTVRGTYEGISSGTMVMIKATGETDKGAILLCKMPAKTAPPEQKKPSEPITATAVVADPRASEEAELIECRVSRP